MGFVVEEAGKPGRLRPEAALPVLERNKSAPLRLPILSKYKDLGTMVRYLPPMRCPPQST